MVHKANLVNVTSTECKMDDGYEYSAWALNQETGVIECLFTTTLSAKLAFRRGRENAAIINAESAPAVYNLDDITVRRRRYLEKTETYFSDFESNFTEAGL